MLGIPSLGLKSVPHHQVLIFMSGLPFVLIGAAENQTELLYIWDRATVEAKAIIALLFVLSGILVVQTIAPNLFPKGL